jgi:formamidopyrimidine-DNA glycosylase
MPELPEVQTVVSDLQQVIVGKKIESVEVKVLNLINLPKKEFKNKVEKIKILNVTRRAKMIVIKLDHNLFLLVHLKMTGQLIFRLGGKGTKSYASTGGGHSFKNIVDLPNKFSHIIFTFTDKSQLFFNDIRKFGWVKLLTQKDYETEFAKFGVEPLSKSFTLKKFESLLERYPKRKIKQFLLDQKLVVGIGNIYADESCFLAQILPTRIVQSLTKKEIEKLYQAIKNILKKAISKRGTSVNNYVDAKGEKGNFAQELKVYQRAKQKCLRCGGVVRKIKLNGRGTHFCEQCQS